jgi:hypothetical protein
VAGLKERVGYNDLESKVFMPNEIFEDLSILHDKGGSQVAFAYSFYYLTTWMYRYCKYDKMNSGIADIKELLGYHRDNKKINYIIKKGGALDQLGYTESSTDYPIAWSYEQDELEFTYLSELDDYSQKIIRERTGRNYKIKKPFKAIWRTADSYSEGYQDGTFYAIENTHLIPFDVFLYCMENDIGVVGFYLYSYLSYRCQLFKQFDSSMERLGGYIGLSRNTTDKYITKLVDHRLVDYKVNDAVHIKKDVVNQQPSTFKLKT